MPNPTSFTVLAGTVASRSASVGDWYSEIPYVGPPTGGTFSNSSSSIISAAGSSSDRIEVWEIPPNYGSVALSAGGSYSIVFDLDHTTIQLNTGNVDYFSLPAGLQILTMQFKVHTVISSSTVSITTIKVNGIQVFTANPDTGGDRTINLGTPLNTLDFNDTFEIDFTTGNGVTPPLTASLSAISGASFVLGVTGTCTVNLYGMTLVAPTATYHNGDPIKITSVISGGGIGFGGSGTNLLHVTTVVLKYIDGSGNWQTINIPSSSFTAWTPTLIQFNFPNIGTISPSSVSLNVVDDGTQFSGSVLLGYLTAIVSTDNSGIYQFINGKPNDTLYIAGGTTTSTVAIPNPFIDTALVP